MKKYKIVTYVPEKYLNNMMDELNSVITPLFEGYDYVFSYYKVKGTWRPLKGAKPFIGENGKISKEDEIKLEFTIFEKDLKEVVKKILEIHPYEKPVIDIFEVKTYDELI